MKLPISICPWTEAGHLVELATRDVLDRLNGLPTEQAELQGMERGSLKLSFITTAKYVVPRLPGGVPAASGNRGRTGGPESRPVPGPPVHGGRSLPAKPPCQGRKRRVIISPRLDLVQSLLVNGPAKHIAYSCRSILSCAFDPDQMQIAFTVQSD
jgi:hypothetical protein